MSCLTWNTIDIVRAAGGIPIQSKTGHAFIKESMRQENAIYGREMSAHYYFRDFAYADSGIIPWLLVAELISTTGRSLSGLVGERMAAYPCSGEVNYRVRNAQLSIGNVESYFLTNEKLEFTDKTDGLSMVFTDWRFNLRASKTEPLLRLNVEAKRGQQLVAQRVAEIETLILGDK